MIKNGYGYFSIPLCTPLYILTAHWSHQGVKSISSFIDSELGHVTCFGQRGKYTTNRSLKKCCTTGLCYLAASGLQVHHVTEHRSCAEES